MNRILKYLGNWGKYQVFIYIVCFLPFMLSGSLTLLPTFTAGVPNARCSIPGYDDVATTYDTPFETSDYVANHLFPPPATVSNAQVYCFHCNVSFITENENCTKELVKAKCSSYIYDDSQFETSLVSEFDMICDNIWMGELLRSLLMIGVFFGAGLFGIIGDKLGRRKTFIICASLQILVCNVIPFSNNFYAYCILQVVIGALQIGTYLCAFVVVMELFGGLPKTIFGIWVQGIFACGYVYVGVAAYFLRDWKSLTWAVSLLTLLYIPSFYVFPESIRWLIMNNKSDEARIFIEKTAKWNGVKIPDSVLSEDLLVVCVKHTERHTILDLFKNRKMGIVTLIVFFTWMVDSLIYYGLSWNTSSLPGNPYVNLVICGLVEIPAFAFCIPLMEYFGRRISLATFLFVSGVCCLLSGFVSQNYLILAFTFLGKLCIAGANAITCNYCTEIFPTVVRNAGTGFALLMGRVGSITAPQIGLLGNYTHKSVPLVVFGCCGICAAICDLFLPETKGKQLPDTLDDGIDFVK